MKVTNYNCTVIKAIKRAWDYYVPIETDRDMYYNHEDIVYLMKVSTEDNVLYFKLGDCAHSVIVLDS